MNKYYRIRQIADLLSVSSNTIENWIKAGRVKAVNIGSPTTPRYRIPESEMQRLTKTG